ncbi:MAG: Gfo/Idh/MocA family oxidoreductase [Myxococcales bacterium]|nr:Gfo/Idh/MocA family oxidoreductase [Myxococcales bacterium]
MRNLRGAIVGYGFIAEKGHAPAYRATEKAGLGLEIVAIADGCPARRDKAAQDFPGARIYTDHATLLSREVELDFVDVSTPPSSHAEVSIAALERGLHVLCEKPLATSFADAARMAAHASRVGRVLLPCHNYKHAPVVRAVDSALASGVIGEVQLVTMQTFRNTHARGTAEWRPDWRRERAIAGGGIGMDHGPHTFYLAFDWLGAYPTSITAKTSALSGRDTEDNLSCTITFPHALVNAHLTWTAGVRRVIYTLHGPRGAIVVEDDDVQITLSHQQAGGGIEWETVRQSVSSSWMDASHVSWFSSLLEQFALTIERNEYVSKETTDAVRSIELIEAAYASAARNSIDVPLGQARPQAVTVGPMLALEQG